MTPLASGCVGLEGWQTAIAAVIGFVGLIAAALFNARLNRKRDDRLREREKLSVALAFYGEVVLLRREMARLARVVAVIESNGGAESTSLVKFDENFIKDNRLSDPIIYPALACGLGILDAGLVLSITEFYRNFELARTSLPLLVKRQGRDFTYQASAVLVPARDSVVNVEGALRRVERLAGISAIEERPDMGMAEDIIEHEERMVRLSRDQE